MRKALLLFASIPLLAMQGTPYYSENVTATTAPVSTEERFVSGWAEISATATNTVRVIFSRDYLSGGTFEDGDYVPINNQYIDECSGTTLTEANSPWRFDPSTGYSFACQASTVNQGYSRLQLTSTVTDLLANEDLELVTGDNFTSWTEAVNAGTGTITSEETDIHGGVTSAELTGGTAHVDFSSTTAVVAASTRYVLTVWGDIAAAGDLLDIRIKEATGGTDFLQTDGTWAAGEVDFCNATFDDAAAATFTQCVVSFTTDTGITGLTISANVDVSADVGRVDDFALALAGDGYFTQTSKERLKNTVSNSYLLCFEHIESEVNTRVEYAIIDPDIYADDIALVNRYYTGSAWSTTETWLSAAGSTTIGTSCELFEARTVSTGNHIEVRFRPIWGSEDANETLSIDAIRLTDASTTAASVLIANTAPRQWELREGGRFVVQAASSTVVNFTALR